MSPYIANTPGQWERRASPLPLLRTTRLEEGGLLSFLLNQATILEGGHCPTTFPPPLSKSPINELTSWYLVFFS